MKLTFGKGKAIGTEKRSVTAKGWRWGRDWPQSGVLELGLVMEIVTLGKAFQVVSGDKSIHIEICVLFWKCILSPFLKNIFSVFNFQKFDDSMF